MNAKTNVKAGSHGPLGGIRVNRCETLQLQEVKEVAMNVKTSVKAGGVIAGGIHPNRCETLRLKAMSMKVTTSIKSGTLHVGGMHGNRCETVRREATKNVKG